MAETITSKVVVDDRCSAAFESDGGVKKDSYVLCKQDVGLNAFSLSIGSVIQSNEAVRGIYDLFSVPLPQYSEIVNFISRPIGAVAAAAVDLCLVIVLMFSAYRVYMFGYRSMKDSSIEQAIRDPNTYKAFAGFGVVAALAYKVGDINVGQLLVIGCGLFAMKITVYLFTAMIAIFDFGADHKATINAYEEFLPQGETYATEIMRGLYGAQEGALRTNFANVAPENASMIKDEADMNWLQKLFGFGLYDSKDPTAKEYFSGLFDDTSITMQQSSGMLHGGTGGYHSSGLENRIVTGSSSANFTIKDSRLSNKELNALTSPLFEKAHKYEDLFLNSTTLNLSSPLPDVPAGVFTMIAKDSIMDSLSGLMISGSNGGGSSDTEYERIKSAGSKLLDLIVRVKAEYPEVTGADVTAIVQGFAYGTLSVEAVLNRSNIFSQTFNPFIGAAQYRAKYAKEPFHLVVAEALSGTRELRRYNCIQNFDKSSQEITLLHQLEAKSWDTALVDLVSGDVFPICILPKEGDITSYSTVAPEPMVKAAIEAAKVIEGGADDSANLEVILLQQAATAKIRLIEETSDTANVTESGAALERSKVHMRNIAAYFARVAAMSRFAALEGIKASADEDKVRFLKQLRQQGAVAISSYFMQLSKEQEKYTEVIYNATPKASAKSNLRVGGNMPNITTLWSNDESLVLKGANFPVNESNFSTQLQEGSSDIAAQSLRGDETGSGETEVMAEYVGMMLDMVIPADDVLKHGFGLEGANFVDSLSQCTTTTNCVNFRQHPIATLSIFGKDMLMTGLVIVLVDSLIQALNRAINGGDGQGSDSENAIDGGGFLAKLKGIGISIFAQITKIGPVIKILAIISSVFAIFGKVFIVAGIFIGYVVPMMPYIAQVMMWLGWLAEFLILFCVIPLLIAFAFITKDDGESLFKPSSIISMMASVVLRAPLIFIAFMVFYTLSYAGIYLVNSTLFTMFRMEMEADGVLMSIVAAFSSIVFFVFTVGMYFLIFKSLVKMMTEMPDYVLRPMGVDSLNVQVTAGIETFIAAKSMADMAEKVTSNAGGMAGNLAGQTLVGNQGSVDKNSGEGSNGNPLSPQSVRKSADSNSVSKTSDTPDVSSSKQVSESRENSGYGAPRDDISEGKDSDGNKAESVDAQEKSSESNKGDGSRNDPESNKKD
ncbi:hypothetical protein QTV49_001699 [Vibrio vulnificus]|nr:hypothetical protein [Vibrio vulnificus]